MAKQLTYDYDPESDELTMTFGASRHAIAREVGDEFFVQLDPDTGEVVGFTMLEFSKRATRPAASHHFALPIEFQGSMKLAAS